MSQPPAAVRLVLDIVLLSYISGIMLFNIVVTDTNPSYLYGDLQCAYSMALVKNQQG